ncbi:HAMP domain-containing sensor histidine kinase [Kitasatospora sp. NPDC086791]|uniref:sensor histidine kinase n=1 Tax=Kitasatospora sp. NPDC086791 TaxID=3155178 RepID=UPI00342F3500
MRSALATVALAVTVMVTVSFLVPLALLLRTHVQTQALLAAEQRVATTMPLLTLVPDQADLAAAVARTNTTGRLCVHLPDGTRLGTSRAGSRLLNRAVQGRTALIGDVPGGRDYLQPVLLGHDQIAVVEEFVPDSELNRGLARAWTIMGLLATGLVVGSVLLADRLGARVVRASRKLSHAAAALGAGDLDVRVEPTGPPDLRAVGDAFNTMADRVRQLLATERELVADLSHRLRTPMTALRLAAERIGPTPAAPQLANAIEQLEDELDAIIVAARTPLSTRATRAEPGAAHRAPGTGPTGPAPAESCQVSEVAAHRVGFWAVLAEQQGRICTFEATDEPTPVQLPGDHVAAVVDALVGNVFRHTPDGTRFAVSVRRTAQSVVLVVEDGGPGIADPAVALSRGTSGAGSTGLGLDIARSAAESTRGRLRIGPGPLGGARVEVDLALAAQDRRPLGRPWRNRRRGAQKPRGRHG